MQQTSKEAASKEAAFPGSVQWGPCPDSYPNQYPFVIILLLECFAGVILLPTRGCWGHNPLLWSTGPLRPGCACGILALQGSPATDGLIAGLPQIVVCRHLYIYIYIADMCVVYSSRLEICDKMVVLETK